MVKKLDHTISSNSTAIHQPFIPAEIRSTDNIVASISLDDGKSWNRERVWRYSPFGIELLAEGSKITSNENILLKLTIGKDTSLFTGLVVNDRYSDQGISLIGLRIFSKKSESDTQTEKRKSARWKCSEHFLPTGTTPNPSKFNDYMFFRVEDISSTGMKISMSMRNKVLMRGQRLECTLSVPCVGAVQCNFEIKRIDFSELNNSETMIIGVVFLKRDQMLLRHLAEYLLQFGDGVTGSSLLKDGFPLENAFQKFDFSYVKTEEEYKSVLELRLRAYKEAGKISNNTTANSMADEFDSRSRILIVKHSGKIVGSVRVIFHEDTDRLSYGRYFDVPPEVLPQRHEYAEASRMCTDSSYRGADIVYHLVEHMVLTTVQSGRKFIVSGAAGSLLDLWEKCGFKRLGITYSSKDLMNIKHELILMNTHDVALGKGISTKLWQRVFGRMVVYMLENRLVTPTPLDIIRINILKTCARLKLI